MKQKIPQVIDLKHRRKSFPWQHPKSLTEDPEAHKRIEQIVKSPSYIIAEQDNDFLQQRRIYVLFLH